MGLRFWAGSCRRLWGKRLGSGLGAVEEGCLWVWVYLNCPQE